eukprot:TRINITY_DN17493_c0_g1_i1.p1 TRINITY_DN17493_c0_g1~~TRINITY_DN17493_c0_g1_i1.p1  ORF type:complete len:201 (+),score=15.14 TRINITY_DN17493_c0_g1_i1:488-1090(+)
MAWAKAHLVALATLAMLAAAAGVRAAESAQSARPSQPFRQRALKLLPRRKGSLVAPLSGKDVTGGNEKDSGSVYMLVSNKNGDYGVFYGSDLTVSQAGFPTSLAIYSASSNTIVYNFGTDATWDNGTSTKASHKGKAIQFQYSFFGRYHQASNHKAAVGGTLRGVLDNMFAKPSDYYALVTTAAKPTGIAKGVFVSSRRG